jgi:peptidoglycan/LPS O-acetylase OafA/YrhL
MRAPIEIPEFLLAALVAACCIREDNLAAPLLTARPMRFVGKISYGMYLLHMFAINSVRPILGTLFGVPVFVAGTGVTTALAYVSYRWFETPILRYRDRLRRSVKSGRKLTLLFRSKSDPLVGWVVGRVGCGAQPSP